MERITDIEQFFKYIEVWLDDDNDTIILKSSLNLVIDSESNVVINSGENLMMFSDHQNNKKIFQNTGIYSHNNDIYCLVANAEDEYKEKMNDLLKQNSRLNDIDVIVDNIGQCPCN